VTNWVPLRDSQLETLESEVLQNDIKILLNPEQAWHYSVIPEKVESGILHLMVDEEKNTSALQTELEIILGKKVELKAKETKKIQSLLLSYYPKAISSEGDRLEPNKYSLPVEGNNFLEALVREAKDLSSSDIHIETYSEKCRIRFRVDGLLIDRHQLNRKEYPSLINKVKIAASCDIAEKRMPQDGRIRYQLNGKQLDIRVSILPTMYGEKIVLRLLGSDAAHLEIGKLGFNEKEMDRYQKAIKKPNGIILISGPTGSGKTTTLYATLKALNKPSNNILTIEDPIEYTLEGVNQVQLREDIGLGYPEALKTFLRQDPDVIMLGEIRDPLTAQMAIRAALTGHLVLSTIHTNSAWGTVSRLVDMGVAPYLLAGTLNLSVAQRLLRQLCNHCKQEIKTDLKLVPLEYRSKITEMQYVAKGCEACFYFGYKGRKAIYEVLNIDKNLVDYIKQGRTEIGEYLKLNQIDTLTQNAIRVFNEGETSLEEIYPYLLY